jgi:hypothetical protein
LEQVQAAEVVVEDAVAACADAVDTVGARTDAQAAWVVRRRSGGSLRNAPGYRSRPSSSGPDAFTSTHFALGFCTPRTESGPPHSPLPKRTFLLGQKADIST